MLLSDDVAVRIVTIKRLCGHGTESHTALPASFQLSYQSRHQAPFFGINDRLETTQQHIDDASKKECNDCAAMHQRRGRRCESDVKVYVERRAQDRRMIRGHTYTDTPMTYDSVMTL